MLILTAFSVTFMALIKAAMVMFGSSLAIIVFSSVLILASYCFFAAIISSLIGVDHV